MNHFSEQVLEPALAATALEQSGGHGPLCETAQRALSGLNDENSQKLVVDTEVTPMKYFNKQHAVTKVPSDDGLQVKVIVGVEGRGLGYGAANPFTVWRSFHLTFQTLLPPSSGSPTSSSSSPT